MYFCSFLEHRSCSFVPLSCSKLTLSVLHLLKGPFLVLLDLNIYTVELLEIDRDKDRDRDRNIDIDIDIETDS